MAKHQNKIRDLVYYTLKEGTKTKKALMRLGEWIEVYPGEVFLAHKTNHEYLDRAGFEPCKGPTVYRTQKAAIKGGRKNRRLSITE